MQSQESTFEASTHRPDQQDSIHDLIEGGVLVKRFISRFESTS
jgi:hypothetical protein